MTPASLAVFLRTWIAPDPVKHAPRQWGGEWYRDREVDF